MSQTVRVAAIQLACSLDADENLQKTAAAIRRVAARGASFVCLQELFQHQYFCQTERHDHFALAQALDGPTIRYLQDLTRQLRVELVVPFFEKRAPGVYHNSILMLGSEGESLGIYRKMHIPDDPNYYEKFYFAPGDLGFRSWPLRQVRVGTCICWDQWFPEAARLTALTGAQILVYPTAIGWLDEDKETFGASQLAAWQTMMRSHAIANGVFVIAANRVGRETGIEFWGHSFVCDPYGNFLAEANERDETELVIDCDLSMIETARTHWPFLRDRRIDAYDGLTRRWLDEP